MELRSYRGLARNTGQIVTMFGLDNLWTACKRFLHLAWWAMRVHETGNTGKTPGVLRPMLENGTFVILHDSPRRNGRLFRES